MISLFSIHLFILPYSVHTLSKRWQFQPEPQIYTQRALYSICDCLSKTHAYIVYIKTEFHFIALAYTVSTVNNYPSPMCQLLNTNWSAFLEGILLTLQAETMLPI